MHREMVELSPPVADILDEMNRMEQAARTICNQLPQEQGFSNPSRWHLQHKDRESEADADIRILTTKKANYGAVGGELLLRWVKGVFRIDNGDKDDARASARHALHDEIFVDLLRAYKDQGRPVSAKPSANYAPTVFAKDARAKKIGGKAAIAAAMNRLFDAGRIKWSSLARPCADKTV